MVRVLTRPALLLRSRSEGVGVCEMKARALIDGASFGPEALKAMGQAFDQAWAEIEAHFGDDPVLKDGAVSGERNQPRCASSEKRRASSHRTQLQVAADHP
jgi:hypothetical protein